MGLPAVASPEPRATTCCKIHFKSVFLILQLSLWRRFLSWRYVFALLFRSLEVILITNLQACKFPIVQHKRNVAKICNLPRRQNKIHVTGESSRPGTKKSVFSSNYQQNALCVLDKIPAKAIKVCVLAWGQSRVKHTNKSKCVMCRNRNLSLRANGQHGLEDGVS